MGVSVKERAIDVVAQARYKVERFNGTDKWIVVHVASDETVTPTLFRSEGEADRWLFKHVAHSELDAIDFVMAELKKTR